MDYRKFVVEPGAKVRLSKIDASYTGKHAERPRPTANPAVATYAEFWLNSFKAAAPSFAVEAIAAPRRPIPMGRRASRLSDKVCSSLDGQRTATSASTCAGAVAMSSAPAPMRRSSWVSSRT